MIKQNLLAGLALCTMTLGAHAASPDDSQVWVVSKDWSTKSYNISNLKKIVFHESELSLIDRNDNKSKESYSNLFKLMFNGDPTGVENVTTERLSVVYRDGVINVNGWTEGCADVAFYDISGNMHGSIKAWNGGQINVSHLSKGMYIMKIKGYSMKFIVK